MASSFPTSKDTFEVPTATSPRNSPSLSESFNHVADAATQLETKVGIDSSADTTSIDYKLKSTSSSNPGHKHTLADGATNVTASVTELNYVGGVTSAIQTQLDAKVPTTLVENTPITLPSALSATGKYSGIVEAGTAGTTLAFGDLVYLQASDSRWELTDANAEATAGPLKIGICVLAAAANGSATTILLWGKVRADAIFPTLTIGAPAYISTTAGDIQTAQPSDTDDIIRIVGYGNTADELFFCPSPNYLTHI